MQCSLRLAEAILACAGTAAIVTVGAALIILDALALSLLAAVVRAAVVVVIAEFVRVTATARVVDIVADALAATNIGFARGVCPGALAPLLPVLLFALERAALVVSAATLAVIAAVDLDPDLNLCEPELGAGKGGKRSHGSSERFDRGPPVSLHGDHPR
jgi:hypothetical protein